MDEHEHTLHATIGGMHCTTCADAAERTLRTLPQIESVRVHYPSGRAVITHTEPLDMTTLQAALAAEGYTLASDADGIAQPRQNTLKDYAEILAALVVLGGIVLALQHFHLLPRGLGVSDEMGYGLVFVIGLIASVSSCLAVTGGLLVVLAAKYNEDLT